MHQSHRYLLLALTATLFVGCVHSHVRQDFSIKTSETYFIPPNGPTTTIFNDTVRLALQGNDEALANVLMWNEWSDGEGALNYSMMILDLRSVIGAKRFDLVVASLPVKYQKMTASSLKIAQSMNSNLKRIKDS